MNMNHPLAWFLVTVLLLALCTYLPLKIQNNELRNWVMRWVLVPVSIILIIYSYPIGIEVFKNWALNF